MDKLSGATSKGSPSSDSVSGYIVAIYPNYVLCRPQNSELQISITFSLSVWQGESPPATGQEVVLHEVTKFRNGWRALKASPVTITTLTEVPHE